MPVSGTRLVDANVWLALAFSDHAHHHVAASWFEGLGEEEAAFCRITQMALLRHLTNAKLMGKFTLSQRAAWECYDALRDDGRVAYADEPPGLEDSWRRLLVLESHATASGPMLTWSHLPFRLIYHYRRWIAASSNSAG